MNKKIGCIYYSDNRIEGHPIIKACREQLKKAFKGEIISVSLKPIDFGENYVLENRLRSYPTMVDQIVLALEKSTADYVYMTEHDVLYSYENFLFTPTKDNVFFYNSNVWRWRYGGDGIAIRYDGMLPLSCMCANRKFILDHYHQRQIKIKDWGLDDIRSREPRKARIWGYEPGRKRKRRGGFSDDKSEVWHSKLPNIDIRHGRTFSSPKITMESFRRKPENWETIKEEDIPGWDLKKIFDLSKEK